MQLWNWKLKLWNLKFERDLDEWYPEECLYKHLRKYMNNLQNDQTEIENSALNKNCLLSIYNWKKKILQCKEVIWSIQKVNIRQNPYKNRFKCSEESHGNLTLNKWLQRRLNLTLWVGYLLAKCSWGIF